MVMSGMFYTTRNDMLGRFLSDSIYGKDARSIAMAEYTNPEHPEIIHNIPPCYLVTSKADMLERYTLDFAGELGNKGVEHHLRHMEVILSFYMLFQFSIQSCLKVNA